MSKESNRGEIKLNVSGSQINSNYAQVVDLCNAQSSGSRVASVQTAAEFTYLKSALANLPSGSSVYIASYSSFGSLYYSASDVCLSTSIDTYATASGPTRLPDQGNCLVVTKTGSSYAMQYSTCSAPTSYYVCESRVKCAAPSPDVNIYIVIPLNYILFLTFYEGNLDHFRCVFQQQFSKRIQPGNYWLWRNYQFEYGRMQSLWFISRNHNTWKICGP